MTAPFSPPGKKIALVISIRRVKSKAGSTFSRLDDLCFAHRDAKVFCDYLIADRGYKSDDVILMMDVKGHPDHLLPTRQNILTQIDKLISNVSENCQVCFYFSGHGLDEEVNSDRELMRANGRDDEIVAADGKPILDYILHDRLITPLEKVKGAKLFALLDCCHSENLLDLWRGDGPNIYSKPWHIGAGQLFKDLVTVMANLIKLQKKSRAKYGDIPPLPRRTSSWWCIPLPSKQTQEAGKLRVICLSACRDSQEAHDDCKQKLTFTKCFMDVIAANSNITWMDLLDKLRGSVSDIQARSEEAGHEHWTQEPRYSTSPHMDLTRKATF